MFRLLALLVASSACTAFADDAPVDFANELKTINTNRSKGVFDGRRINQAVQKQRTEEATKALAELVAKAEKADAKSLKANDQAAIANAYLQLRKDDEAVKWANDAISKDAKNKLAADTLFSSYINLKKPADAETVFNKSKGAFGTNLTVYYMRLAQAFSNAKNRDKTVEYLSKSVDASREIALKSPATVRTFLGQFRQLVSELGESNQIEDALKRIDANIEKFAAAAKEKSPLAGTVMDLKLLKVSTLQDADRVKEARDMLEKELAAVKKSLEAKTGDIAMNIANFVKLELAGIDADDDDVRANNRKSDLLAFLGKQAKAESTETDAAGASLTQMQQLAMNWMYSDPKAAKKVVEEAKKLAGELGDKLPGAKQVGSTMAMIESRLNSALEREKLIGKKWVEPKPEAWVNGAPISGDEFNGKVVLLDFWAVWCGPCIATFPHLREWHEKHSKEGLVIVGVTRHYKYSWDSEANSIKRESELSHEEEQKACEQFAAFHNLKHRLAYMPDDSLSKEYQVTGIPQAVLVDRNGIIRMVRVGSGEANAKALDRMIKRLLAEKVGAPAGN